MVNKRSTFYLRLFSDLLLLNISFIVSAILAQSLKILLAREYMFVLMMALNFIWYFFSNVINFYEDFTTRNLSYQFIKIVRNVFVQALAAILFIFIVKEDLFTRNFIILYSIMLVVLISLRTQVLKYFLGIIRGSEKNIINVLIIGAGEIGKNFYKMISDHEDFGFNFVGFLDDDQSGINKDVIGKLTVLDKILVEKTVDEVIIALPIYASNQLDEIIKTCNRRAVRANIIPDYFRFVSKKFQISMIGNFPIITVRSEPLGEFHWRFVKRAFDIIFSILAIIFILSWLSPLLIVLNRFFSSGALFFVQERIGVNNQTFHCYKFRTMHVDNKSTNEYQPTVEGDLRITKIGKFLRKSNIDELPQFINVFKGEMSVVGPRPHPLAFNEIYEEMVEEIKIRSWVKPGITGWAQVHGLRGDVPDYDENKKRTIKRIEYDLWYIENWSFWLDIQVILMTVWQMIKGETKGV